MKRLFAGISILCFSYFNCYAEDLNWMLGTWDGSGYAPNAAYAKNYIRTFKVDAVSATGFSGIWRDAVNDVYNTELVTTCSGIFTDGKFAFTYNETIHKKEPPSNTWCLTLNCPQEMKFAIEEDKIKMIVEMKRNGCNGCPWGINILFKPLIDFDTTTQRYLVNRFGSPELAKTFVPLKKPVIIPQDLINRKNELILSYDVTAPEITIELEDNMWEDGDIVDVYHNNQLILRDIKLTNKAQVFKILASTEDSEHEIILVAKNLGDTPPNTGLLRIIAGKERYSLRAGATMEKNAKIFIKYKGAQAITAAHRTLN